MPFETVCIIYMAILKEKLLACMSVYTRTSTPPTPQLCAFHHAILTIHAQNLMFVSAQQGGLETRAKLVNCYVQSNLCVLLHTAYCFRTAVCFPPCQYGQCIEPNMCQCQSGWIGTQCTEGMHESVLCHSK